jgi:cell division ATPase FtsA
MNGYVINNLEGHKARKIGAMVLATFLPNEVVEGLYSAVSIADLTVANLTLEPIAAINIAIPEQFRLLNIALVDVGAGTSDISITKDGSIVAYGMIPHAGDEITESILGKCLVDFKTAEKIKLSAMKNKGVSFKDIMGISHKMMPDEIREMYKDTVEFMTKEIADKIIELNGGKSVNAVFVVGGGGKYPGFVESLAKALNIPKERAALRGEEVLTNVIFREDGIKKDPLIVTPVGICLNYYENKNSFVQVKANGSNIKIFDNNNLNIADVALALGIKNEDLFPKNGNKLKFTYNGVEKIIKGDSGEPAKILLNGKTAFITSKIKNKDVVEITASTIGQDAHISVGRISGFKEFNDVFIDGVNVKVPTIVMANGSFVSSFYDVQENDNIETKQTYTISEIGELTGVEYGFDFTLNGEKITPDTVIKAGDVLNKIVVQVEVKELVSDIVDELEIKEEVLETTPVVVPEPIKKETKLSSDIFVVVNGKVVRMTGKNKYIFVDVLDFYDFDTSVLGGTRLILKVNELSAEFTTPIKDGDIIDIYWER